MVLKIPESLRVLPDGNNNAIGITSTSPRPEDLCFQSPEMSSDLHLLKVQSNPSKLENPFYTMLVSCVCTTIRQVTVICVFTGDDHLVGKMGLSESYNLYDHYRAFVWS
ncbi:hypothetical protein HA466_0304850 [Hirschfeldia incana]|nr:hypothetical protein HA466_0304850 [Hirschfeldia incana]